jgi:DNA adenine methylase
VAKTIGAIVPYFGCKRMQANGIIEQLGEHQAYWEPFAGSLAVLLAKTPCRMEVVNDLNRGLVNLARVVQDDTYSVKLFDRLNRTVFCRELYHEASHYLQMEAAERADKTPRLQCWSMENDLGHAYHYFVVSWMGRNGLAGTEKEYDTGFCVRYTSNGGDPAVRFRNAVESIPNWWQRLRGVTILNEDAFDVIERVEDKQGTVIYADPPYFDKKGKYLHDFQPTATTPDCRLALRRFFKTRVVVSLLRPPVSSTSSTSTTGSSKVVKSHHEADGERQERRPGNPPRQKLAIGY